MSLSTNMDLEAFVLRLLLKWKHKFKPTKIGLATQIKNEEPYLGLLLELL